MLDPMWMASVALKASAVLLITASLAFVVRRASASIRHLVWSTGLAATLLLPVAAASLPSWPILRVSGETPAPAVLAPVKVLVISADAAPAVASTIAPTPIADGAPIIVSAAPARGAEEAPIAALGESAPVIASADGAPFVVAIAGTPEPAGFMKTIAWGAVLPVVWLGGALLGLGWIVLGFAGVARWAQGARPVESAEWLGTIEDVLEQTPIHRSLRFLESDDVEMPCTWGTWRPTVLLPAVGAEWTEARRRNVIIHELAHVHRLDCLTHLVARLTCAIHWFNPLAWWATRSARMAREQACDDAVLNAGGRASEYADELLETARGVEYSTPAFAAALAMARRSQLSDRLVAVLDSTRQRAPLSREATTFAAFTGLALALPLAAMTARAQEPHSPQAPAAPTAPRAPSAPRAPLAPRAPMASSAPMVPNTPPAPGTPMAASSYTTSSIAGRTGPCAPDGRGNERTVHLSSNMSITGEGSMHDGKGNMMVAWSASTCSVAIRVFGRPTFTEDETDIAGLTAGGKFDITHEEGSTERRYTVTYKDGSLVRRYTVEGEAQPIDSSVEAWRRTMIIEFLRRSGWNAEVRAKKIRATRGFDGLLDEIREIANDGGKSAYLKVALEDPKLSESEAVRILTETRRISSDGDRAAVLSRLPLSLVAVPIVQASFIETAREISSDGDKAAVLHRLVEQRPSPKVLGTVLDVAKSISSDGDRAGLLEAIIDTYPNAAILPDVFFEAARGIESDGDLSGVLTHALRAGKVDPASCDRVLGLVRDIDSDGDRAATLAVAMRVLEARPACLKTTLELTAEIGSDGDRAHTLQLFSERIGLTDELRPAYFKAVNGIGSDGDRRAVLTALVDRRDLSDAIVASLLESAAGIGSDGDRSAVLVTVAGRGLVRTAALRDIYRRAAEGISSDGDRSHALRAIGIRETN
ncbi:MAG: M56 family metallopeptidase [Gemmatimonadota bacterium]